MASVNPRRYNLAPLPTDLESALDHFQWCWDCGATRASCAALWPDGAATGRKCCPDCRHRDAGATYIAIWGRAEEQWPRVSSRVRWRLSLSDPPPVRGDLLVAIVGGQPGPGWTVVPAGNAAWRYAVGDEAGLLDVLIVSPPDTPDEVSTTAPVTEAAGGGILRGPALASEALDDDDAMPTTPSEATVIRVRRRTGTVFQCPTCGHRGAYVGDRAGVPQVRLNRPTNETILAASGNVIVFGCLATAPQMTRWRLVLADG